MCSAPEAGREIFTSPIATPLMVKASIKFPKASGSRFGKPSTLEKHLSSALSTNWTQVSQRSSPLALTARSQSVKAVILPTTSPNPA